MNEFDLITLPIPTDTLLKLIGILSDEKNIDIFWIDLLLVIKNITIDVNNNEPINIDFTIKNVLDILTLLSKKEANIYDDFYKNFLLILDNNEQKNELIIDKISTLNNQKNEMIHQHYVNGINVLRLYNRDAYIPS